VTAARADGPLAHLTVPVAGDAGLRLGELIGLEWQDIDLNRRRVTVARSEWKGQVTTPKGARPATCR
jgi:integrase